MAAASAPTLTGSASLAEADPEIAALIEAEKDRQRGSIDLIASENFTSHAVMEALGSCLTNKVGIRLSIRARRWCTTGFYLKVFS